MVASKGKLVAYDMHMTCTASRRSFFVDYGTAVDYAVDYATFIFRTHTASYFAWDSDASPFDTDRDGHEAIP